MRGHFSLWLSKFKRLNNIQSGDMKSLIPAGGSLNMSRFLGGHFGCISHTQTHTLEPSSCTLVCDRTNVTYIVEFKMEFNAVQRS